MSTNMSVLELEEIVSVDDERLQSTDDSELLTAEVYGFETGEEEDLFWESE